MILAPVTLWPLLVGLPAAPSARPPAAVAAPAQDDAFAELLAGYEKARAEWDAAFEAAGVRARPDLRQKHPAIELAPRFEALAEAGEGRALLWLASETRERGLSRAEGAEAKREAYGRVFRDHLAADWLGQAIDQLAGDAAAVGEDQALSLLRVAKDEAADSQARALATLKLAELLAASEDEAQQAEGKKLLEDYEKKFLSVGAEAIDFRGTTVDGHQFELSDYRGKVVLVDFYGFW